MIRADHLTLVRLLLLPLPVAMLYQASAEWRLAALVVFVLLGLTDVWDGRLARRQGATPIGEALDIIADRAFLAVVYCAFADLGVVPLLAVTVLLAREYLVAALRVLPTVHARTGLAGKLRTTFQMYGAGLLLLLWIITGFGSPGAAVTGRYAILGLMCLILSVTIVTAAVYVWKARMEIAAGLRSRPLEILRIGGAALIVPLLWAPLLKLGPPLSPAVGAFFACELARLLVRSHLLQGTDAAEARADRGEWGELLRLAFVCAAAIAARSLAELGRGMEAATGVAVIVAAVSALEVIGRLARSSRAGIYQ